MSDPVRPAAMQRDILNASCTGADKNSVPEDAVVLASQMLQSVPAGLSSLSLCSNCFGFTIDSSYKVPLAYFAGSGRGSNAQNVAS